MFIGPCGTVLQDAKECLQSKEEQNRLLIKNLEEENERLRTRCTDLLNDLEKLRKQEAHWRKEKHSVDAEVKVQGGPEATAVSAGFSQEASCLPFPKQEVIYSDPPVGTSINLYSFT